MHCSWCSLARASEQVRGISTRTRLLRGVYMIGVPPPSPQTSAKRRRKTWDRHHHVNLLVPQHWKQSKQRIAPLNCSYHIGWPHYLVGSCPTPTRHRIAKIPQPHTSKRHSVRTLSMQSTNGVDRNVCVMRGLGCSSRKNCNGSKR